MVWGRGGGRGGGCGRGGRRSPSRWRGPSCGSGAGGLAVNTAAAAFSFVDVLLGRTSSFDVSDGASVWRRKGWDKLDSLENLGGQAAEGLGEVAGPRGGLGPAEVASATPGPGPRQGRAAEVDPGAAGDEGLCRSDDLARMLPSEACLLAKGMTTAVAKRLFLLQIRPAVPAVLREGRVAPAAHEGAKPARQGGQADGGPRPYLAVRGHQRQHARSGKGGQGLGSA